jgi:hypothetical protein
VGILFCLPFELHIMCGVGNGVFIFIRVNITLCFISRYVPPFFFFFFFK